ncbi:hypothetical protein C7Y69_14850 [Alteromonas sp. KS69]|uniref:hypothetical protein n=1 Tax=Alteromonas sp. KS69 TaxID=2109917 RepID=UPI000F87A6C9|nr:hypothetical protein [Alteromonas sp. KS69]RUP78611.1 hypothetical protein C7Y69_14850 [Alteromonas sp. KS69]|tara:strand:- start:1540 stop:1953 length:414 start_codon:yes stop_codon:yes gene_type:complete
MAKKSNSKNMLPNGRTAKSQDYFFRLPKELFKCSGYLGLNKTQRALLIDLCSQYNMKNNGNLSLAPSLMEPLGWDEKTVRRNKKALIDSKLIRVTGHKELNNYKYMYLYALSWLPVDDCSENLYREALNEPKKSLRF